MLHALNSDEIQSCLTHVGTEGSGPVQELMPFLEDHELIRPLAQYDAFVHDCVQGTLTS